MSETRSSNFECLRILAIITDFDNAFLCSSEL